MYRALSERERLATTGVGSGIAIPHGRADIDEFRVAMAISRKGMPFDAVDGGPAHILVAVLAPLQNPADQLRMLARISRVLERPSRAQARCSRPNRARPRWQSSSPRKSADKLQRLARHAVAGLLGYQLFM